MADRRQCSDYTWCHSHEQTLELESQLKIARCEYQRVCDKLSVRNRKVARLLHAFSKTKRNEEMNQLSDWQSMHIATVAISAIIAYTVYACVKLAVKNERE